MTSNGDPMFCPRTDLTFSGDVRRKSCYYGAWSVCEQYNYSVQSS